MNPLVVESTFSTVEPQTKVTRGAAAPAAALAMVFKLVESAQPRRRAIIGAHLVPWAAPAPGSRTASWWSGPKRVMRELIELSFTTGL
nr:hypothetical protein [Streptomyces sp. SP18BB07]